MKYRILRLILAGLWIATPCLAQASSGGLPATVVSDSSACKFTPAESGWTGSCGPLLRQEPKFTIAKTAKITTGAWRKGVEPISVWSGKMTDPASAIELEIYPGGSGVLRTELGWFPVTEFAAKNKALTFSLDTSRPVPPNELDRRIVERAAAILSSDGVWNRVDTRQCSPSDTKWSIYCAMVRATIDETGAVHHRRPALQVIRAIVEKRSAGRKYTHRLMDYNNDPSTKLEDVKSLFAEAIAEIGRKTDGRK